MKLVPRNYFLDDVFNDFMTPNTNSMKCDVYEKDGNYNIEVDIPGFRKEDIKVESKDGYLTITAEKKEDEKEEKKIIQDIKKKAPSILLVGLGAPKQEKWIYSNWQKLNIHCHVGTIGAVFDFFAGTTERAPLWWQQHSLEWLYRLIKEPKRMWRRYLVGNVLFLWNICKEKCGYIMG